MMPYDLFVWFSRIAALVFALFAASAV